MSASNELTQGYGFDGFYLDPVKQLLLRDEKPVHLNSKAFEVLLALVTRRGQVVTKNELMELVWPEQIVEESNLTVHISALRKALGEHKGEHRFIVTIPGRGYRFVAAVYRSEAADEDLLIESHTVSRIIVESEDGEEEQAERAVIVPSARSNGQQAVTDLTTSLTAPKVAPLALPTTRATLFDKLKHRRAAALIGGSVILLAASSFLVFRISNSRRETRAISSPPSSTLMKIARLTTVGHVTGAAVSPDGKYFVYSIPEGEGESLWVRQVTASRNIQIVPPEAIGYWGLTFSPDGAHVYATVFEANRADTQLWRVPTLGGAVERLPVVALSSVSFAPDGRRFAFTVSDNAAGQTLVKVADADGSNVRVRAVRKQPSHFEFPGTILSWSPDGELIACVVRNVDAENDYMTVVGVRASDGAEIPLTSHRWADVSGVAWLRDGSGLVVVAGEKTGAQIWLLSYTSGEARQITNDLNIYGSIGTTGDSKLLLVQRSSISGMWVMNNSQPMDDARQISSESGGYEDFCWTPDGRIVYRSRGGGDSNLWIVNADGTNPRQLTTNARVWPSLAISSDGRYIVFASARSGKVNLWRYEFDGGDLTQLTSGDGEAYPSITPDNHWVIYQRGLGPSQPTLWKVPLAGGDPTPLAGTHALRPDVSPDGRAVAHFYMEMPTGAGGQWRIGVASIEDGSLIHSFGIPARAVGRVARWTPDGRALTYVNIIGGVANIWRQPLAGGSPQPLTNFSTGQIETFAWSRDGRQLAVERMTQISDVALISEFR
ncbi:MAG: winged helix-turn-helix domain-containing protein [Pyrinomonadaceae bacterium]